MSEIGNTLKWLSPFNGSLIFARLSGFPGICSVNFICRPRPTCQGVGCGSLVNPPESPKIHQRDWPWREGEWRTLVLLHWLLDCISHHQGNSTWQHRSYVSRSLLRQRSWCVLQIVELSAGMGWSQRPWCTNDRVWCPSWSRGLLGRTL